MTRRAAGNGGLFFRRQMYIEFEEIQGLVDLDPKERELDELTLESANSYIHEMLGKELAGPVPAPVKDAVLMVFVERRSYYAARKTGKKREEKPLSQILEDIHALIEPYAVKNI